MFRTGKRGSAELVITIDMQKAMGDGMQFRVGRRGSVLTSGFFGCIPTRYFLNAG